MNRFPHRHHSIGRLSFVLAGAFLCCSLYSCTPTATSQERPNILWISCEDINPNLGCYGDSYAKTPHLDRLAAEGVRFTYAFAVAPVCAPNRSAVITGMYATTIGTLHMRTGGKPPYHPEGLLRYEAVLPPEVKCFTEYLRATGYYCTNNGKTDYQFAAPFTAWDENGPDAHWRNRPPGTPFFSVFNFTDSHESRNWPQEDEQLVHDPATVQVPPYYPDTPIVRENLARYYDNITRMDQRVGKLLAQLEEDDLADDTLVWFWSDHGAGLPRAKYWLYDSGIHIPLIIRWPGKLRPGTVRDDVVSSVDFAPTVLAIAGVQIPPHMQGQIFLGPGAAESRRYIFAASDRQDETYEMIRCVRDERFKYIRNYMAEKPYAEGLVYKEKMPIMLEMRRLHEEGKLAGAAARFFGPKPKEELYDTTADPHEIVNLAESAEYRAELERLRAVHEEWTTEIKDLGHIPETELIERMWSDGQQPQTAAPIISIDEGPTDDSVIVRIDCATEGASIGYTTDEDENQHWRLYTGPLTLPKGSVIRAKAIRYGYKTSPVRQLQSALYPFPVELRGMYITRSGKR